MLYEEYAPCLALADYIQCYFLCEQTENLMAEDSVFASGTVEVMFNLNSTPTKKVIGGIIVTEPYAQLWGQTINPITFVAGDVHKMLGVRFHSHAAASFFEENVEAFNDQVIDFEAVKGVRGKLLREQLTEAVDLSAQLELLNIYFIQELTSFEKKRVKAKMVRSFLDDLSAKNALMKIGSIAESYGISSRYLHKLSVAYTGLSPALYCKVTRFRKSLRLISSKKENLTTIAHQLGYYDQPHFVRDFKFFTGTAPSRFHAESSSDLFVPLRH